MKCLIIDDDEIDRLLITKYASDYPGLIVLNTYANALESLEVIKTKGIDLLFMDIHMPVINGIDFFRTIDKPPLCIFITSYSEYALDAFDMNAIDYLLKPVTKKRFDIAVQRAFELISIRTKALHYDLSIENEVLTIKEGNSIHKVMLNDIIYLEALTNYTKIVTNRRNYITLRNLKNFLEVLPKEKMMRIHRSYAVAKQRITRLHNNEIILDKLKLPLGKTYKKNVTNIVSGNA